MTNEFLSAAKAAKNDEFYTQYYDIEREITHISNLTLMFSVGKPIFGSNAKTIPGSNSCFIRGANTGISLISKPMP